MEILGIGAPELVFILLIAIIVLGPRDMQRAGRTIGRWLNQLVRSDSWRVFQRTSAELRNLPRNLMREANMEMAELDQELRKTIDPRLDPTLSESRRASTAPRTNQPNASAADDSSGQDEPIESK
jgi:sec-independent protein translocase protein TatB